MYVPSHFEIDDDDIRDLLASAMAGDLVTWTADRGLEATTLPFVHAPAEDGWGSLHGHLARGNPHWRHLGSADAMVLVRGADGYVSPGWYPSKRHDPRVVPTWDYVALQVHGEVVVHDDVDHVRRVVEALTEIHEAGRARPWAVADAPADYVERQLRAVVGVELRISRIEGKAKLSQNRSAADVVGVIGGLEADGHAALAQAVARANPDVDADR